MDNLKTGDEIQCSDKNELVSIGDDLINSGYCINMFFDRKVIEIVSPPDKKLKG